MLDLCFLHDALRAWTHRQCHTVTPPRRLLPLSLNPREITPEKNISISTLASSPPPSAANAAAVAMATRRCLLRLLTRRIVPHSPQPLAPFAIAAKTLTSLPEPLAPAPPRAAAAASLGLLFPSRRYFATRSSGDEGDEDDEEHYEDEGSGDEWGEGDEETPAAKPPSGKTEEEKLAEAEEIGYKVTGPLGSDEKPFKPYEPVFAVVQV